MAGAAFPPLSTRKPRAFLRWWSGPAPGEDVWAGHGPQRRELEDEAEQDLGFEVCWHDAVGLGPGDGVGPFPGARDGEGVRPVCSALKTLPGHDSGQDGMPGISLRCAVCSTLIGPGHRAERRIRRMLNVHALWVGVAVRTRGAKRVVTT